MKTKTYSFTEKELVKAFKLWNADYCADPTRYSCNFDADRSKGQARDFLRWLKIVKTK
jgi:hypothetical protein